MDLLFVNKNIIKFEYEILGSKLNLYRRINNDKGTNILRFSSQVNFNGNLEESVKDGVDKYFLGISLPPIVTILVYGLNCQGELIRYQKKNYFKFCLF